MSDDSWQVCSYRGRRDRECHNYTGDVQKMNKAKERRLYSRNA